MISFPNISQPSYPLKETPEDNSIRSQFEDGSLQSRRKFTRSRMKYQLSWNSLPKKEYDVLMNFIRNEVYFSAVSFMWTHPQTGKQIEVRITNVETFQLNTVDYYSGGLELTEV